MDIAADVAARRRASQLSGLMFIHLKRGLEGEPVAWQGCHEPLDTFGMAEPGSASALLTDYGVLKSVQRRLAEMRTDLDSFTEVEAHALMTSGYLMTREALPGSCDGLSSDPRVKHDWPFLVLEPAMTGTGRQSLMPPAADLLRQLEISKSPVFKVILLSNPLRAAMVALGVLLLPLLIYAL